MHIRRSETILGTANIERLCEKINPKDLKETVNPFDSIIRDYLSMLDCGYSENDAVMSVMLRAHDMVGSQFDMLLANAKLNIAPNRFFSMNKEELEVSMANNPETFDKD